MMIDMFNLCLDVNVNADVNILRKHSLGSSRNLPPPREGGRLRDEPKCMRRRLQVSLSLFGSDECLSVNKNAQGRHGQKGSLSTVPMSCPHPF